MNYSYVHCMLSTAPYIILDASVFFSGNWKQIACLVQMSVKHQVQHNISRIL